MNISSNFRNNFDDYNLASTPSLPSSYDNYNYIDEPASLNNENLHGNGQTIETSSAVIPAPLASTSLKNKIINNINLGKKNIKGNDMKRDKKVKGAEGKSEINVSLQIGGEKRQVA